MKLIRLVRTDRTTLIINSEKIISIAEGSPEASGDKLVNTAFVLVEGE